MSAELKSLQVRIAEKQSALDVVFRQLRELHGQRDSLQSDIETLRRQVRELTESTIVVSEHALLRYCERVLEVDIDAAKREILTPQLVRCIETLGNGKFPIGRDGLRAVVKNRVVVSLLSKPGSEQSAQQTEES